MYKRQVIGIVGGFFAAIFGQWDSILWALLVIMVLDYLTGIIKAIYTKTMSSEIGFKGLLKKITILIIVALSNVLQQITGDNVAIREIVIMFYIANEGISVLENVAVIYPRMPQKLKDILPVSYTHLDVYKRQGWLMAEWLLCSE